MSERKLEPGDIVALEDGIECLIIEAEQGSVIVFDLETSSKLLQESEGEVIAASKFGPSGQLFAVYRRFKTMSPASAKGAVRVTGGKLLRVQQ